MSKKILIISRSFYPMNSPRSFRTTELAKEMASNGHDITLLLPYNNQSQEGMTFAKKTTLNWSFSGL
jgi:hypothetical protein